MKYKHYDVEFVKGRIYIYEDKIFDHAATTAVREEVVRAMLPYLGVEYGNPSSVYSLGRKNKKIVEENRSKVAKAINADQNEIYFTSCGSRAII